LTNAKKLGVKIISPEYILVNKEIVNTIHKQNFEVLPWTVNDIDTFKKMIEYKVDGIITDYPVMLNDYLKTI
jgi:glycerophosphoryl diester phosphodiesterase